MKRIFCVMRLLCIAYFLLVSTISISQRIDNSSVVRSFEKESFVRLSYDNDYFTASDKNYTQGINIEVVDPLFKHNPIQFLLPKAKTRWNQYGFEIQHNGFTPKNIRNDEIQVGDRPFAAAIMINSFKLSTDSIKKDKWVSSFSLGMIGPIAFGEEMQVGIHKAIGGVIPQGWKNQIKNHLLINYMVGYEKQLIKGGDNFSLDGYSRLRLGIYNTSGSFGFSSKFGVFKSCYQRQESGRDFQTYLYINPIVNLIGYDATLQGGWFNDSPYTINSGNINRFTFQHNFGLVIKTKRCYVEYFWTTLTKEFRTGEAAKWGGVKFGYNF